MHELAGCRVLVAEGVVDGFVIEYAAGVLRLRLDGDITDREVGDPVTVQVLDPVRGECTYRGLLARLPGPEVDVVVMEAIGQRQRRSAARAPYQASCIGYVTADGERTKVPLTVLDVSATGLQFGSRREVPAGSVLVVHLPADGATLELKARVLRAEEGRSVWRHGAELVDLDEPTREKLYRLVLRLQREEVRRQAAAREEGG